MTNNRGLVTLLAALGGILIIIGAFLGFFLSFLPNGYGPDYSTVGLFVVAVLAFIFGVVILIFSGYTHFQGVGRGLGGALAFLVLGILTWAIAGRLLLVAVGAFFTVVAGLVLLILLLARESNTSRS